jgi:cytochrome c oxidase assembly protein subunit 15
MHRKAGFYLAVFAFCVAVIVVVLGAFTRLSHAGLGCPDWPTCYGHLWVPNTADEIHAANQAFAATPVETEKTWPEQIHRIFASSLGLLMIGLVFIGFRNRGVEGQPLKLPLFMLCFVVLQGLFGMWTVTLLLWPQVVTLHLLGGFATLSLLWLLVQRLGNFHWQFRLPVLEKIKKIRWLAVVGLLVVVMQIALGGWTSSNYAALACADLPTCHNEWIPAMDFSAGFNIFQHIGPNYLGGQMDNQARTAIHFSHRIGAIVTAIVLLALGISLFMIKEKAVRYMAAILCVILVLQITLGLSNVFFALPLPVAVAHNAVGAMLLLTLVALNHRIFTAQLLR